jgi:hypothetical protein
MLLDKLGFSGKHRNKVYKKTIFGIEIENVWRCVNVSTGGKVILCSLF